MTDVDEITIFSLPEEILGIILESEVLSGTDVLNFGATCTYYRTYVLENQQLWKAKAKLMLLPAVFEVVRDYCDGSWLEETKSCLDLEKMIKDALIQMSPKFYRIEKELDWEDVIQFLEIAMTRNVNYFLTICFLCEIVKKGNYYINRNEAHENPYTLTGVYYAKLVLRYLIHGYLVLKWAKITKLNEMTPETVIHFFLQWIDTATFHMDEDLENKINELTKHVENLISKNHPLRTVDPAERSLWAKGHLTDDRWDYLPSKEILTAVGNVVYHQKHVAVTNEANFDTLDIAKAISTKYGNITVIAAIYEAVARRCGVKCNLITFPKHIFMDWRPTSEGNITSQNTYAINLLTGELERKKQCPHFSDLRPAHILYRPYLLLQHLIWSYNKSMGAIRNMSRMNMFLLMVLTDSQNNGLHPNRRSIYALIQRITPLDAFMDKKLDIKCIDDIFLDFIWQLANLNQYEHCTPREVHPKLRDSKVKFAVGMICYHAKYDYVCIIRAWDTVCAAPPDMQKNMSMSTLQHGDQQPFYSVIAMDYSDRYVAQENLRELSHPNRLYHLEDMIAKEFSYFDGFAYVPNDEKAAEYPRDREIQEFYRSRSKAL